MSYYIAPRFIDKLSIHITKNFLNLARFQVPLLLGIHGKKGEGKTFQCDLVFAKMGITAIKMSGGEMESPDAGDPSRLIRLRYREAAELIRVRGQMAVLFINDLDTGVGRFDSMTQYTVNNQLVHGTLMNIADDPTNVQLPGSYDPEPLPRVPIIVTGNDFSTLYAPLIRDGRMDKFYWEPNREERLGIVGGIYSGDGLSESELAEFIDRFPNQSVDFFAAVRSRIYDDKIREFINQVGLENLSKQLVKNRASKPVLPPPYFSLARLVEYGTILLEEQNLIHSQRLAQSYTG